jgi:hypothetical protein
MSTSTSTASTIVEDGDAREVVGAASLVCWVETNTKKHSIIKRWIERLALWVLGSTVVMA